MKTRQTNPRSFQGRLFLLILAVLSPASLVCAQTTTFTYQGRFTDAGTAANGIYDMQFKLFDGSGNQVGSAITNSAVNVSSGVFTVQLDFGGPSFSGADRFLDIGVRLAGDANPYTILSPRQQLTSAVYAIRAGSAMTADTATTAVTATNATQLGGVAANQFVQTNDSRLSNSRTPTPGSSSYIQNSVNQQTASNFNISGSGTAGGALSANVVNSTSQYNIGGARALSVAGTNTFAGINAGNANNSGTANSFFGNGAGQTNSGGSGNAFFGSNAGRDNSTANFNAFFGSSAGVVNSTGDSNSFFGFAAGAKNATGFGNSFYGTEAGNANTTASNNSFFGRSAGKLNTTGASNSFFGYSSGSSNTTGAENSFFGVNAGAANTTAGGGTFFGYNAGESNTTAPLNSFFGYQAGQKTVKGGSNSFFGAEAGGLNTSGDSNSFFGRNAGGDNTIGISNSFFGLDAGKNNVDGNANVFVGTRAGQSLTTGIGNTFVGFQAGQNVPGSLTEGSNTLIGYNTKITPVFSTVTHATAIGADAVAKFSNQIVLGTASDSVNIPGTLSVYGDIIAHRIDPDLDGGGSTDVCVNQDHFLSHCSSSLRYKTNFAPYLKGFDIINRLRPITFDWKQGGMRDLGFGAEDVERVDPLLVTYNKNRQVEGVKYDRITAVLVNAVKEQQAQIERQQSQINLQQREITTLKLLIVKRHRPNRSLGRTR